MPTNASTPDLGADLRVPPAIIDVEASGFGRGSYPIEVGFLREDGHAGCSLITPLDTWAHWDSRAEAAHGISRTLLIQHGRSVRDVARWLNEQLAGRVVYSVGGHTTTRGSVACSMPLTSYPSFNWVISEAC